MKKTINAFITIVISCICAVYLYYHRTQFNVLSNIGATDIICLTVAILLFFTLTGYTFRLLVNLLEVELSFTEIVGLSILTNFGNYLGPTRPGAALKAIYLKTTKELPYSYFSSILAANTFLVFFMTGFVGILLLSLLKISHAPVPLFLISICLGLILLSLLPLACNLPNIKKQGRLSNIINLSVEGFKIILGQKRKLLNVCGAFLGQFILSAIIYYIAFQALGVSISLLAALIIGVFTSISNFFTITPNNLGIQEAVSAYLFTITGFDFTTGVVGATFVRVLHMIITFGLTPFFAYCLLHSQKLSLTQMIRGNAGNAGRC